MDTITHLTRDLTFNDKVAIWLAQNTDDVTDYRDVTSVSIGVPRDSGRRIMRFKVETPGRSLGTFTRIPGSGEEFLHDILAAVQVWAEEQAA